MAGRLEEVTERYFQASDDCAVGDLGQTLTLQTQDGGAGPYLVIETTRWALDYDEIDAFAARCKALIARVREEQERE